MREAVHCTLPWPVQVPSTSRSECQPSYQETAVTAPKGSWRSHGTQHFKKMLAQTGTALVIFVRKMPIVGNHIKILRMWNKEKSKEMYREGDEF